jgi:hypothetical protein
MTVVAGASAAGTSVAGALVAGAPVASTTGAIRVGRILGTIGVNLIFHLIFGVHLVFSVNSHTTRQK